MDQSTKNLIDLNKSLLNECRKRLLKFRNTVSAFKEETRRDREWLDQQERLSRKITDGPVKIKEMF